MPEWLRRQERSGSGAPVHRHEPATEPRPFAHGDLDLIARVEAHVESEIGPVADVFHEVVSTDVHIDVLHCAPNGDRPVHVYVTCGMSERPMPAPAGAPRRSELLLALPPTWPVDERSWSDECHYWPIRWLKLLARLPHEYDTWLGHGHSVPNGDPPGPLAPDTALCAAVLLPPLLLDVSDLGETTFLAPYFLHHAELALKLEHGLDALLDAWEEREDDAPTEVVRKDRPSAVA